MSPAAAMAAAFFIKPPLTQSSPVPFLKQFPRLYITPRRRPISCLGFPTSKSSLFLLPEFVTPKPMAGSVEARSVGSGSGDERSIGTASSAFEQEALIDVDGIADHQTVGVHDRILNRLSKWFVAAIFGGVILLRHDGLALWAAMGSVLNVILSTTLKQILNQDRPASAAISGPGMPSSHAQSIFFAVGFVILTTVEWLGLNALSIILSGLAIALGSYFSWLRIALHYHTTIQVVVGAVVGSIFSVLWFSTWGAVIQEAYSSNLWVQILLVAGAACFCVGFVIHVLRYWINDEH